MPRRALAGRSDWRWRLCLWLWLSTSALHARVDALDADEHVLVINATTRLSDIFECSQPVPIGYYNEYYMACRMKPAPTQAWTRVEIRNARLHAETLTKLKEVHVELQFALNCSAATSIRMVNSTIAASAVTLEAAEVNADAASTIDVSSRGFKFGPGFNAWVNMGGSYGGIGGVAITGRRAHCDELPRIDLDHPIGDVSGSIEAFQGYGSGGGSDLARGGGRIEIQACKVLHVDGALQADGGSSSTTSDHSAGAGGTIIIQAGQLQGKGQIHASGGDPSVYDAAKEVGGGGGGSGGRIAVKFEKSTIKDSQIQAYGGGALPAKSAGGVQWCQLGADGTILQVELPTKTAAEDTVVSGNEQGKLFLTGRRDSTNYPNENIRLYGCTQIFDYTDRGEPFVPASVTQIFVTGGAVVCASSIKLQRADSIKTSIMIEPSCKLHNLMRDRNIRLSATLVSLQSYAGPIPSSEYAINLIVDCADFSLTNAQVIVDAADITASSSVSMDKYSTVQFHRRLNVKATADVKIEGTVKPQPDQERPSWLAPADPILQVSSQGNVLLMPQDVQIRSLRVQVDAAKNASITLPYSTPFLSLQAFAANLTVAHVSAGGIRECAPIERHADARTCARWDDVPYLIALRATNMLGVGNLTGGSIILCSDEGDVRINGSVVADALGCASGQGPGHSAVVSTASGGAGHGGRGGNVAPGNTGGGIAFDAPPSEFDRDSSGDSPWPKWPGSGAASGEDASTLVGGSGGGMIYVAAHRLVLAKESRISARGGNGIKRGGGGAGGSITLFIGDLDGSGVVDVSGGQSSVTNWRVLSMTTKKKAPVWELGDTSFLETLNVESGGGGGGGIIRTFFNTSGAGNGDAFVKNGGVLRIDGGAGPASQSGEHGIAAASSCSGGRGDALCLPCAMGSFSPADASTCLPCEPGSFSDQLGLAVCKPCEKGSFNADFGKSKCQACAPGSFASSTGAKLCDPCAPGSFAGKDGSAVCAPCPIGSISIKTGSQSCEICGIGETTKKAGAIVCEQCTQKPQHSTFNVRGNCTYACDKGRNGLDCLTPFERLVKPIGGVLGFALIVTTAACAVLGTWGFITYRHTRYERMRYAMYQMRSQREQQSLATLTQHLTPRLTTKDLGPQYLARLYLEGDNVIDSPWHLNPYSLPPELQGLVRDDAFAQFAAHINKLLSWSAHKWLLWLHRSVIGSMPVVSVVWVRKRQLRRVIKLAKYVNQYAGAFFCDMNLRMHGAQLKVGFSPDFSLAFIDVLGSSTANTAMPMLLHSAGKRHTKTTLVVAGCGTFMRPFFIDTNDVVVRAVPSQFHLLEHKHWIDFVASANQQLWALSAPQGPTAPTSGNVAILRAFAAYVTSFNQFHYGIQVSIGTYLEQFHPFNEENVEDALQYMGVEHAKLALRVTKQREDEAPQKAEQEDLSLIAPSNEDRSSPLLSIEGDPRSSEFRFSQIRMEALFATPQSELEDETEALFPQKPRRASTTNLPTPDRCGGVSKLLLTFVSPVVVFARLRHVRSLRMPSPWVLPMLMITLTVADIAILFWILMEYYCVQVDDPTVHTSGCSRAGFILVLSILPLALVASPILALVFLSRRSVYYAKLFAISTVASGINLLVALICGIVYLAYIHEVILAVVLVGVLVKFIEKELALRCMAQYASERPMRGWRGLYTTKEWYDASYAPLVHDSR